MARKSDIEDGIPVGAFTRRGLRGTCRMRDVDDIVVRGKTRPVYDILDYHDEHSFADVMDCLNYLNEGVRHYRASDRDRGIAGFREALGVNEGDKLSSIYIDRRIELQQNPPRECNGIWHLKSQ